MTRKNVIYLTTLCLFLIACEDKRTSEQITTDINEKIENSAFDGARKDAKILIEREPNSSNAYFLKGLAESKQKNTRVAMISFKKAIALDSTNYKAYVERAKLKIELGDYRSAILDCETAKFIKKDSPEIYKTKGIAFENLGDATNAIIGFEYAIKYGDNSGETFYKLGMLLLDMGKISEACDNLSKAGELGYMDAYEKIKENCNNLDNKVKMHKKESAFSEPSSTNQSSQKRDSKETWVLKKSSSGKFNILFPTSPSYSKDGIMDRWLAKDKNGEVLYRLATTEIPLYPNPKYQLENNLLPSLIGDGILLTKSFTKYQGYDALDFLYKYNNGIDKNVLYHKARAIIVGKRVYVLMIQYYHSNLIDFDKFANSLTMI